MSVLEYIVQNKQQILSLLIEHIQMTLISLGLSILIGVPLGILICYIRKLSKPVIGLANVIQAIPSMALLGFFIPVLGIGKIPAVITVLLYSLLPIIKNTYTGIVNISDDMIETAKGIGLTKFQVLRKIQIPLALPVIMAGVRISAVNAVGLMTISAFIGAGGLGYLVYSGIRTVNNSQILAGALPACLLALLVDYLGGAIESLVTPVSMQVTVIEQAKKRRKRLKAILAGFAVVTLGICLYNVMTASKTEEKTIVIGGKDFTEQSIVANMAADIIEAETDITVDRQLALGGTQVSFSALKSGEIDLYIEYSGTAYGDTLGNSPSSDVEQVYNTVKEEFKEQYDIEVLKQMGFNNTFALAVKQETAQEYDLSTISDLAAVASDLRFGSTLEFLNRNDGYPGLSEHYNLSFGSTTGIDGSSRYLALMNNETDVLDAYATDGLIKKFDLVVLEDDQQFFLPYYAIPLVRGEILEQYPEIEELLDKLGGLLSDEVMVELNYKVDEEQIEPEDVAARFLEENWE
ncbi:MAG: glycine betaine ABC transporter substrate-binding protein [Lachnospiraceae bacterium]